VQVRFSQTARDQLLEVKAFIARDNPEIASKHIKKVIDRTKKILEYPFIGKVNAVYNQEDIREIAVEGYKVIYQIALKCINVLVVYKNIDLDESDIGVED
jgi:plasmid stabilization system protein ParE